MWLPWLEREFGWTVRTADRYMQVAEAFKLDTVSNFDGLIIDGSGLYCLASPSVPQEVGPVTAKLCGLAIWAVQPDLVRREALQTVRLLTECPFCQKSAGRVPEMRGFLPPAAATRTGEMSKVGPMLV